MRQPETILTRCIGIIDALVFKLKRSKLLSGLLSYNTGKQFVRYAAAGFAAFLAEFSLFALLYRFIGLWYIYSNTVAMMVGVVISFFLNRRWSFRSKGSILRQFAAYCLLFVINLGISDLLIYLLSGSFGLAPLLSKLLIMGILSSWNFILYRNVIYAN